MGMNRRQLLGVIGLGALATLPGGAMAQTLANDAGVQAIPLITGDTKEPPAVETIPEPNELGDIYAYYYIGSDDSRWYIDHTQSDWGQLDTVLAGYDVGSFPSSPTDGTLILDKFRQAPAWWDGQQTRWEHTSFVDNETVLTSGQTVANQTTEEIVYTAEINPDALVKGRTFQLDLSGTFGTANTSDQFTVRVDLADVDAASVTNAAANVPAGTPWNIEFIFTVYEHGATGTLEAQHWGLFNEQIRADRHSPISVDTTQANTFEVGISWSAADPENTCTLRQAHVKQMG